jgi:hypothetical protein
MAADDDKNEASDPWADLVADDLGSEGEEVSFSFVEKTAVPQDEHPSIDEVAQESAPGDGPEIDAGGDMDLASDLEADLLSAELSASGAADEAAPPLSVFAPDEAATDQPSQSSIEIGTGFSGIDMAAEGDDSNAVTAAEGLDAWGGLEATDGDADPFEATVPVAAAAAAVTAPRKTSAKSRAKGGGLGPMIGVVAGGVMAIPITMAILLWGFQKDPFGVAKQVPESMSFLLPQKFRPGFKKQAGGLSDLAAAPSLDDLAAAGPSGDASPAGGDQAGEPASPAAETGAEPALEPGTEPAPLDAAVAAVDPLAPLGDDAAKSESPKSEPEDPLFPDPDAPAPTNPDPLAVAAVTPAAPPAEPVAAAEPVAPALPPLDMAALEAAVAEATTALEAAAAAENHTELAGKKLLVGWYRSLARTADELVKLQNEAADSGRPLDGVPDQVAAVFEGIAAEKEVAATLPLLARDWLAYARRDSEGILLPVTFDSAKKVGPYWRSKVMLETGEHPRELGIISREEPAAVAGEKLLVTGVVFDGDVIWAAEMRPMPAEPVAVDF